MSLATCDSLLAIKTEHKTLFEIIFNTSNRLLKDCKPLSVDSIILPIVPTDATAAKRSSNAELPLSFIPFRGIRPAVVVAPTPFQTFTLVAVTHLVRFPTNVPRCSDPPIAKTKISTFLQLFLRLATPLHPGNAAISLYTAIFAAFLGSNPRLGRLQQSLIAKKLQPRQNFCF